MILFEVVMKLIGPVQPIGETHVDEKRLENLKTLTDLTDKLLTEIDKVVYENQNRHEASIKEAVKHGSEFFDKIGIEK